MKIQERKDLHDYVNRVRKILGGGVKSYDSLEARMGAIEAIMDMMDSYIENGTPKIKPLEGDE